MNECSKEDIQNLQLYPNCVSTLPDKTKNTLNSTFLVDIIVTVYFIIRQQE